MGSSRPTDRSIGEATFLPQWMRGKFETRFDYTDSTFSPPADDTFLYIRYLKQQEKLGAISGADKITKNDIEGLKSFKQTRDNRRDSLVNQNNVQVNEPKIVIANKPKVKSVENDFNNAQAVECGRSIVHVASQIMSTKFGKSNSSDAASSAQQQVNESMIQSHQQQRRGSKSLPATPLASPSATPDSSPKSRRRPYGNRFFTGPFIPTENPKNGWLLSSILSSSRELVAPKIDEEDEQLTEPIPASALSRKKSISSQNLTYLNKDEKSEKQGTVRAQILQAKPSELREMNFWSPTSM